MGAVDVGVDVVWEDIDSKVVPLVGGCCASGLIDPALIGASDVGAEDMHAVVEFDAPPVVGVLVVYAEGASGVVVVEVCFGDVSVGAEGC